MFRNQLLGAEWVHSHLLLILFTRPVTIANHCQLHVRHRISRIMIQLVTRAKIILQQLSPKFNHFFVPSVTYCLLTTCHDKLILLNRSFPVWRSGIMFDIHTAKEGIVSGRLIRLFTGNRHPCVTIVFNVWKCSKPPFKLLTSSTADYNGYKGLMRWTLVSLEVGPAQKSMKNHRGQITLSQCAQSWVMVTYSWSKLTVLRGIMVSSNLALDLNAEEWFYREHHYIDSSGIRRII